MTWGAIAELPRDLQWSLLETRQDAEDESVKDLRRELRIEKGLEGGESFQRYHTDPVANTAVPDLPCPELGYMSHVAQPGGFRRLHIRRNSEAGNSDHAMTSLVQMMLPMLRESDLDDETPPVARGADASNVAVAFVIAKNFFGSAFLITPKGFEESGLVGGPLCLAAVYLLELQSMMNLIKCREVLGPGMRYEDLGASIHKHFPSVLTFMILLCQFGFCCIWLVTNAENLSMVVPAWSATQRLWIQVPFLLPLMWVRRLKYFAVTNIIGIAFTAMMIVYLFFFMGDHYAAFGPQPVQMVNTANTDLLLWLGSCAYAYEGINIVLPAYECARDKAAMPKMLAGITWVNTMVYIAFGCLTYLAFGSEVGSVATLNLPRGSLVGAVIPLICVLVGLASFPLQAFVIYQTYEPKLPWSDSYLARKWQKNTLRTLVLLLIVTVTWLGGDQLQNFLALVGGFCCGSLALIFPSMLHAAICRPSGPRLFLDALIFLCGVFILVLSTYQAIISWH